MAGRLELRGALTEYGAGGTTECFSVVQSSTGTVTDPELASDGSTITAPIVIGTSVVDHALVTGATGFGTPTGSVSFFICDPTHVSTNGGPGTEFCATGTGTQVVAR